MFGFKWRMPEDPTPPRRRIEPGPPLPGGVPDPSSLAGKGHRMMAPEPAWVARRRFERRDFAARMLAAMIVGFPNERAPELARVAVEAADALIAELDGHHGEPGT